MYNIVVQKKYNFTELTVEGGAWWITLQKTINTE